MTALQFPESHDRVVIRARPLKNGCWKIDENGESSMYASMAGGDIDCEAVVRWREELIDMSPVEYDADAEELSMVVRGVEAIVPAAFRVAEAAEQLFAIATSRQERRTNDFKARVIETVRQIARELHKPFALDAILPIAGDWQADCLVDGEAPLIVIAANSAARLLEAEVIYMQYRYDNKAGFVLAVADGSAVPRKQLDRANYYTDKAVSYSDNDFRSLIKNRLN